MLLDLSVWLRFYSKGASRAVGWKTSLRHWGVIEVASGGEVQHKNQRYNVCFYSDKAEKLQERLWRMGDAVMALRTRLPRAFLDWEQCALHVMRGELKGYGVKWLTRSPLDAEQYACGIEVLI